MGGEGGVECVCVWGGGVLSACVCVCGGGGVKGAGYVQKQSMRKRKVCCSRAGEGVVTVGGSVDVGGQGVVTWSDVPTVACHHK